MNLAIRCGTNATKYIRCYWTKADGGSTNKCKKKKKKPLHLLSLHLYLLLYGMTPDPVTALLWMFYSYFHQKFKKRRYLSQSKFKNSHMSILCLRERINMEQNKSLVKLIVIHYLSFPWTSNVVLPVVNVWALLRVV